MNQAVTFRPKIWIYTSFLWLTLIPIIFLVTDDALTRTVVFVVAVGGFGFALSKVYEGVTISENEVTKRTIPKRRISFSDIQKCQYKSFWINNPNANDTGLFVFILKPREPKIAGLVIPRGFTISRYGWFPSDRRTLFSMLKSKLEQSEVEMDARTQQKLVKAAAR